MGRAMIWLTIVGEKCLVQAVLCFFSSRRRHTRYIGDWSSDVCSSDLGTGSGGRRWWVVGVLRRGQSWVAFNRRPLTLGSPRDIPPGFTRVSSYRDGSTVMSTDRKSTRLNSSHRCISYAVFCLKKKKTK